jgi:hypothetical protein
VSDGEICAVAVLSWHDDEDNDREDLPMANLANIYPHGSKKKVTYFIVRAINDPNLRMCGRISVPSVWSS